MSDVVVLGDVNVDILAMVDSYPPHGGDAQALSTHLGMGGTSLNTAIMLTRLGIQTTLIARVGCDALGDYALAAMAHDGLNIDYIQRDAEETTGIVYVAVTPDGQRTMLGGAGANRNLDVRYLPLDRLATSKWLHLTSYVVLGERSREAATEALQVARSSTAKTSLDIGQAPARLAAEALRELADAVDVLMPSGDQSTWDVARPVRPGLVIRKSGGAGALLVGAGVTLQVPAFSVAAVDTTGAGDAFNAGFIAGQIRGLNLRESLLLASACGAAAAAVRGAGSALPNKRAALDLLNERPPPGWQEAARRVVSVLS